MSLFDDVLGEDESLFRNDIALDSGFVPKIIPFRENEQREVAQAIKPLFNKKTGGNVLVFGNPGVGKTLAIKHVLEEISEKTDDILVLYINCWKKNSSFKIAMELCNLMGYPWTQNRKKEGVLNVLIPKMNKKEVVLVLDEVDRLDELGFLYQITEEIYRKSIILITNNEKWANEIDQRVRSRLMLSRIEFRKYNRNETGEILRQRVGYAFHENVIGDAEIEMIADKTYEHGDIRLGLYLLKEAGNSAEARAGRRIEKQDVKMAFKKMIEYHKNISLDEDEEKIIEIIKKNPRVSTAEIFQKYTEMGGEKAGRTFQRKIEGLVEAGVLMAHREGVKRIISFK